MKKMRRRFIVAAMTAFGTVMLVLVTVINIVNYCQTTRRQDELAENLLSHGRSAYAEPQKPPPPFADIRGGGPEAEFTTRFFVMYCGPGGDIQVVSREHIASIDEETAREYTEEVLKKGKERGYYGDYRYRVDREEAGMTVLFLNASHALQFMKSLLLVSLAIGSGSILLVFILVVFFSQYAIKPYVKNIERQKRFITDASHELKTPITSIATSADIAAMEYEGDEWISNIRKQTVRLARLVNELVALSRLDEEMPFPEKNWFSLSDAAWEAAEPFGVLAKAKGKKYFQEIEEGMALYGDRDSIQQMISILLDNGIKYSGECGEVHLYIYHRRRKIYIEVSNTCDLPDISGLDRLFDRFYRLDASRSSHSGGSGIGLSMARAIAEAHGGRIGVESEGGKSICFQVVLAGTVNGKESGRQRKQKGK